MMEHPFRSDKKRLFLKESTINGLIVINIIFTGGKS